MERLCKQTQVASDCRRYLFNIGYNIYNKQALNALPIPYTMATLQVRTASTCERNTCHCRMAGGIRRVLVNSLDHVAALLD